MGDLLLAVVIVLLLVLICKPSLLGFGCNDNYYYDDDVYGYATQPATQSESTPNDYGSYLENVGLESTIKQQHKEWLDNMQINLQPRMYSIRDDCDDGETPRWGLLKKDYSNVINENQNISLPSGRTCTEGDGGNSRWGGYGFGLCPVQRSI
jgi:hypothetical protein